VLAYHLLCWISKRLEAHNDMRDWQTIRRLLVTHSLVTTRLPLADGRIILNPAVEGANLNERAYF
jgi:hypothetical protein